MKVLFFNVTHHYYLFPKSIIQHLLNNATFHTSLLACALEVVLATYVGKP